MTKPDIFSGVHAVLYAMFLPDETLDHGAMTKQVEYCVAKGCHGITVLGLATEGQKLTLEERKALVKTIGQSNKKRLPYSVTISGNSVAEQVGLAKFAVQNGADWLILQPPTVGTFDAAVYLEFVERVAREVDLPVAIQNAPQYLGRALSGDDIALLRDRCPNLAAVKSEDAAINVDRIINAAGDSVAILGGRGGLEMIDNLRLGCRGFVLAPDIAPIAARIFDLWHQVKSFSGETMTKASSASNLIRGGQTAQHWWRMGWQVLKYATVVAAAIYVATFAITISRSYSAIEMRIAFYYEMAERGVEGQNGFNKTYTFKDADGQFKSLDAVSLYRNPTYRQIRDTFFITIHRTAWFAVLPASIMGLLSLVIFSRTGNRIQENEFVRGAQLVSVSQLKAWSNREWKKYRRKHKGRKTAKPLTISGIPFPPNAVEAQTCLYGTVGVGKSNAMIEMLQTIREIGGRGVIYDRMGTFVSRFYDENTDFIINPFDNRSHSWNPFDDVLDAASFTQLSEVMIPEHRGAASDPFWSQSARIVFAYAARELYKNPKTRTMHHLLNYVIKLDASELAQLISATPGAHFFNEEIEKTAQSIRANLIAELQFLEFLRDDAEAFSIRKWMSGEGPSFLFLTGDAEHAAATRNIISAILEIAANALMSQGRASEPRCYFFLDEVPTLNRMPFLISSLAEIRQFGGAFVLGYQVYSQLEDIYGREAAQSIAGTTNNRIVFNTPDFRTAKLCSESLGNQDIWEANSNISVGSHEARDGVGLTQQRVERPIVSPAEMQTLPQFRAAVKFAYNAPAAIVTMDLVTVEETQPSFQPYLGDAPGFGTYSRPDDVKQASANVSEGDTVASFHEWCAWRFPDADVDCSQCVDHPHPHFRSYYPHFRDAHQAGTSPEFIHPLVLVEEGLMRNVPAFDGTVKSQPKPKSRQSKKSKPRNNADQSAIPSDWDDRFPPPYGDALAEPVTNGVVADLFTQSADNNAVVLDKPTVRKPVRPTPKETAQPALPFPTDYSPPVDSWEI